MPDPTHTGPHYLPSLHRHSTVTQSPHLALGVTLGAVRSAGWDKCMTRCSPTVSYRYFHGPGLPLCSAYSPSPIPEPLVPPTLPWPCRSAFCRVSPGGLSLSYAVCERHGLRTEGRCWCPCPRGSWPPPRGHSVEGAAGLVSLQGPPRPGHSGLWAGPLESPVGPPWPLHSGDRLVLDRWVGSGGSRAATLALPGGVLTHSKAGRNCHCPHPPRPPKLPLQSLLCCGSD